LHFFYLTIIIRKQKTQRSMSEWVMGSCCNFCLKIESLTSHLPMAKNPLKQNITIIRNLTKKNPPHLNSLSHTHTLSLSLTLLSLYCYSSAAAAATAAGVMDSPRLTSASATVGNVSCKSASSWDRLHCISAKNSS
jgi:hypothetical protein